MRRCTRGVMDSKESEPPQRGGLAEERPSAARLASSGDCECVLGPWRGLFVAGYVTQLAGVFYGYAKLYERQPQSPWCADALMKVGSPGCPSPAEALDSAVERGLDVIEDMLTGARDALWKKLILRAAKRVTAASAALSGKD